MPNETQEENASFSFLGGYFRAILDRDPTQWQEQLDVLVEDSHTETATLP